MEMDIIKIGNSKGIRIPYAVLRQCGIDSKVELVVDKTRPCVVISPLEMNEHLRTVMIAPITSRGREGYPTRVRFTVGEVDGWIVLDQIRTVDKVRLCGKIGVLEAGVILNVKCTIKEMLVE